MAVASSTRKSPAEMPLFDFLDRDIKAANPTRFEVAARKRRPRFPGPSFDPVVDEVRLTGLQSAIFELMRDCQWRTFSQIKAKINRGSENGIAAMLRNLRSKARGKHTVNKRRVGNPEHGLYEYQLIVNPRTKTLCQGPA